MLFFELFTNPVLRAPTIASVLLSASAALMGTILVLRKRALSGETLSHASYPGIACAVLLLPIFGEELLGQNGVQLLILCCATVTALLGQQCIDILEHRLKVNNDTALCFTLASFFGIGLTIASVLQTTHSMWYAQIQGFLYGQPATMIDAHIHVGVALLTLTAGTLIFLCKEIQLCTFDRGLARVLGIRVKLIDSIILLLTVITVVVGIRCVGIVLMSAVLIAPPIAARQLVTRFSANLIVSAVIGGVSGFLGNFFSAILVFSSRSGRGGVVPTGPLIALSACSLCALALLLAPQRGICIRMVRILYFQFTITQENLIKSLWRCRQRKRFSFRFIARNNSIHPVWLSFLLWRLQRQGWLEKIPTSRYYQLTVDGNMRGAYIVRLHRLWEVYLVQYLGAGAERVHKSAEEMEHILTPQLEAELNVLLQNPTSDPHKQPIPPYPGAI